MNTLVSLYHWLPVTLIAAAGSALILTIRVKSVPKSVEFAGLSLMWLIFTADAAFSHQPLIERVSKGAAAVLIATTILTLAWRQRHNQPSSTGNEPVNKPLVCRNRRGDPANAPLRRSQPGRKG